MTFTVFLIHALAERWKVTPPEAYAVLSDTGILDEYILPCYDILHTQGREYLVDDITEFVREKGAAINAAIEFGKMTNRNSLTYIYRQNLDEDIIEILSKKKNIDAREAMEKYYRSELAKQIATGENGIDNLSCTALAEDLIENELT